MRPKERILQFIDFKGISKRKFCEKISMSHTIFNKPSAIGSDKLENIFTIYPELNMDWIITGRGEMLVKDNKNYDELSIPESPGIFAKMTPEVVIESQNHFISQLRKMIVDKMKIIELQEEKINDLQGTKT